MFIYYNVQFDSEKIIYCEWNSSSISWATSSSCFLFIPVAGTADAFLPLYVNCVVVNDM